MLLTVLIKVESGSTGDGRCYERAIYEQRECVALRAIRYEGNNDAVTHFTAQDSDGVWHKVRKSDNKAAKLPVAGSSKMPWNGRELVNSRRDSRPVWKYSTSKYALPVAQLA